MNIKEFEVLRYIAEHPGALTQRIISEETGYSLGNVNSIISSLTSDDLVSDEYSGLKRPGYRGSGTIVPQQ